MSDSTTSIIELCCQADEPDRTKSESANGWRGHISQDRFSPKKILRTLLLALLALTHLEETCFQLSSWDFGPQNNLYKSC